MVRERNCCRHKQHGRVQPGHLLVNEPQSVLDVWVLQGDRESLLEEKSKDEVEECVKTASKQLWDEG